jgi:cytochrome P450
MVLNQEVQSKAQAEIDAVLGTDRLPMITDREHLPYVHALVKEVFRWSLVTPLTSHKLLEDDVFEGYSIPKDAVVVANIWYESLS